MTTIIFVRHGETIWNQERRYQGQKDSSLSSLGLIQAQRVADFLSKRTIDLVYTSDLKRAFVTAEIIAKQHNLTPSVDFRLREMSFGAWEGKTRDEVMKEYPALWQSRREDVLTTRIPGGELPSEVVERFLSFLNEQTSQDAAKTIVVVSHGGALRLIIATLLHIPVEKSYCLHQSNTGLSELVHSKTGRRCSWECIGINSVAHLL